jgi:hypothetical protein
MAQSISIRRPECTGAVDAPIGNCWISRGPLGLGLRLDEGDCGERGAERRPSSRATKLRASNNPAAGIYTTNAGSYTTFAGIAAATREPGEPLEFREGEIVRRHSPGQSGWCRGGPDSAVGFVAAVLVLASAGPGLYTERVADAQPGGLGAAPPGDPRHRRIHEALAQESG